MRIFLGAEGLLFSDTRLGIVSPILLGYSAACVFDDYELGTRELFESLT